MEPLSSEARDPGLPRWFPLYLSLLAAAALSPLAWSAIAQPWAFRQAPSSLDLLLNILIFVPFGLAFRDRRLWLTLLAAFLLAAILEVAQRYLPRNPNPWDIASNCLGALLGARVGLPRRSVLRKGARGLPMAWLSLAAAVVLAAVVGRGVRRLPPTDFSNWEPFPLVLGVEEPGDPRWGGRLRELTLSDRESSADPARAAQPALLLRGLPGLVLVASLAGRPDTLRASPDAPGFEVTERGLAFGPGAWRLADTLADRLRSRLTTAGQLALEAELEPTPPDPRPRRILALSAGYQHRNFALGQQDGRIYLKLRTPRFGPDGRLFSVAAPSQGVFRVTAWADRHWIRLRTAPGETRHWYLPALSSPWHLGLGVTLVFGSVVVLVALGFAGLGSPRWRQVAVLAGALAGTAAFWATGIFQLHPASWLTVGLPLVVWTGACLWLVGAGEKEPRVANNPRPRSS